MLTASVPDLELVATYFESAPDSRRVEVAFPINKWAGSESSAVVYFELEPGRELPVHTDSAEEVLFIVAGNARARVGEEEGELGQGDLAVIPAMVPHGLTNIGDGKLEVVGFFGAGEVVSTFEEPVQPIGAEQLTQGAPPPSNG